MREYNDAEWNDRLREIGNKAGFHTPLGTSHRAIFADRGPVLLVSFELRADIRTRRHDQIPLGYSVAQGEGVSSLTLIADEVSWFRTPEVFAFFDRLVDEGFYDDFERVIFFGEGSCGYAAAAFSVTAPGCTVIALQPQATLDPRLAGWDTRFRDMRRIDFTSRYGFAPEMIEGAETAFILFDPDLPFDAMHAALFYRTHVTLLPCRHLGEPATAVLAEMGILEPILADACAGRFDALTFWRHYRTRRNLPRYLRALSARLEEAQRPLLNALLCRNVAERLNAPRFRARLTQLEQKLQEFGTVLPPSRTRP